jgi:hypothetical protein
MKKVILLLLMAMLFMAGADAQQMNKQASSALDSLLCVKSVELC